MHNTLNNLDTNYVTFQNQYVKLTRCTTCYIFCYVLTLSQMFSTILKSSKIYNFIQGEGCVSKKKWEDKTIKIKQIGKIIKFTIK